MLFLKISTSNIDTIDICGCLKLYLIFIHTNISKKYKQNDIVRNTKGKFQEVKVFLSMFLYY
jgi:hypothetical protein